MQKPPSYADFDRPYRRGFVLGISLAELFIILVFLLLLTMVGYATSKNYEHAENTDARRQAVGELKDRLVKAEERAQQAESRLESVITDNADVNDLIAAADKRLKRIRAERDELRDMLTTAESSAEIGKQIQQIAQEKGVSPNDLLAGINAAKTETGSAAEIGKQIQQIAQEKGVSPNDLLAGIKEEEADRLGQDSPCWYKMAKRLNGEDYERALYVFDILISDDSIFVKDVPAPAPKHKKQKEALKFDRAALGRELDYEEFKPAFLPFKAAGENKRIRHDRRCTFYVRVWDATSDTNKLGYKRAHNVIVQGVFNTYEVKEDFWPH